MKPVTDMKHRMILTAVILGLIFCVLGVFLVYKMMRAFDYIIPSIRNTANFNFREDAMAERLSGLLGNDCLCIGDERLSCHFFFLYCWLYWGSK